MKLRFRSGWGLESLIGLFALIPVLVPYGFGLWALWTREWLVYWLWVTLAGSTLVYVLARLLDRRESGVEVPATPPDAAEAEARARESLRRMMNAAGPADVASPKAAEGLIREVLRVVAEAWYPGKRRAELQFTVPEALALAERLARRLRLSLEEDVPALRHVRISHVVGVRKHARPAQAVWNLMRVGRFALNPVGAVVAEVRRGAMRSLTPAVMASVRGKAAALLVRETGEAAIWLYSGQLRYPQATNASDTEPPAAPVFFVTGQPGVGKSRLIHGLCGSETAPAADDEPEETPRLDPHWVESDGLAAEPEAGWLRRAGRADAVLWVVAAHRADRAPDLRALQALRGHFRERVRERTPPILVVLNQVDRLEPAREWEPPYEIEEGERHKEHSIRAARKAAALAFGLDLQQVVPAMCEPPDDAWNLDGVWRAVLDVVPAARRVYLERQSRNRSLSGGVGDVARTLPGLARAAGREWKKK